MIVNEIEKLSHIGAIGSTSVTVCVAMWPLQSPTPNGDVMCLKMICPTGMKCLTDLDMCICLDGALLRKELWPHQ